MRGDGTTSAKYFPDPKPKEKCWVNKPEFKPCAQCGVMFTDPRCKKRFDGRKYCSRKCGGLARTGKTPERMRGPSVFSHRKCKECLKVFRCMQWQRRAESRNWSFCSMECINNHFERRDRRGRLRHGRDWNELLAKRTWTAYQRYGSGTSPWKKNKRGVEPDPEINDQPVLSDYEQAIADLELFEPELVELPAKPKGVTPKLKRLRL